MSYSSRVYRQRNAHSHDEGAKDASSEKKHDTAKQNESGPFFQPKLDVNKPGDKYEKEADSVADAVVNNSSTGEVAQRKEISGIQRLSTSAEDEKLATNDARMAKDKEIQEKPEDNAKPKEEEKKPGVQQNKS